MLRKIWIAMSTPFQANFFYPLIERLEGEVEFLITARKHDRTLSILEARGLPYLEVGHHGGKPVDSKLQAYADAIMKMTPVIKREAPELLLTERWPEAVRVAFGLNIPAWTFFYDEREFFVNRMVFPLSSKIFSPTLYRGSELAHHGVVDLHDVVWFRGFHACYLKGHRVEPAMNPFKNLKRPILLVRPEPEAATYFQKEQGVLRNAVKTLAEKGDFSIVVMPRTQEQRDTYRKLDLTLFDATTTEYPVAYADVVMGAAETMLMEAFVMGVPTISTVYWEISKPVALLHRLIPHSTDHDKILEYVYSFLEEERRAKFREESRRTIRAMDNPIDILERELEKTF